MDEDTRQVFAQLAEKLDRDRTEIESSLIAHRTIIEELLAWRFEGEREVFDRFIGECIEAVRRLSPEPGRAEETRQELAAQVAAKLAVIGERVRRAL